MAVRVGVLGCGHFAKTYSQVLGKQADVSVVAVAARDKEKAATIFPQAVFFADWKELLLHAETDVVIVVLPIQMHLEVLTFCFAHPLRCRALLSEKPVAATPEEGRQLIDLYHASPKSFTWLVAENYRMERAFSLASTMPIGTVRSFHFNACHAVSTTVGVYKTEWRKTFTSYLVDSAVHYLAALRLALGNPSLHVTSSTASKLWPLMPGDNDSVAAAIKTSDGAIGQFFCSFGQYAVNDMRLLICGDKGNVEVVKQPGCYVVKSGDFVQSCPWEGVDKEVSMVLEFVRGTISVADTRLLSPEEAQIDLQLIQDMLKK